MTETLPSEILTRKALRAVYAVQQEAWQTTLKSLDIGSRRLHRYKLDQEMEVIEKAAAILQGEYQSTRGVFLVTSRISIFPVKHDFSMNTDS